MFATLTFLLSFSVSPRAVFCLPNPFSPPTYPSWNSTKAIIAFGDSYTYIQGTHGRANYSFIGDLQNFAFTPKELLQNRIVQNQTATAEGGPNWLEYVTGCGLKPGLTDPRICETQLWDFAFAGADITETLLPLHHNFTVSFVKQIEQFRASAEPVLGGVVNKGETLVVVWIGINDVNDSKGWDVDFYDFYTQLVGALFEALDGVWGLGYRRFLVMNLPPLDRTPGNIGREGSPSPTKTMVDAYDQALVKGARGFEDSHRKADVKVFDANTFLNGILDRHEEYGIENITGYCASYDQPYIDTDPERYGCLPLDRYFWFDAGHMTSHVHEILAGAVRDFLN